MLTRIALIVLLVAALVPLPAAAQPAPAQQDEFVPIDQLPAQDQLPAAPLLVAAYTVVLVGLFGYVLSVARRLGTVQKELERLESNARRDHRSS